MNAPPNAEPDRPPHPASTKRSAALPRIQPLVLRFFRNIVRRYLRRHFHAARIIASTFPPPITGPLIVYGNHPSWWDPMVLVLLGEQLFPNRRHYAPMDESGLRRYPILRQIGIFPIQPSSTRGPVQLLRTAQAVLAANGVLWITPQGRFADARQRPLAFRAGLAAIAARTQPITLLPVAIEYTFWDERLPELLIGFGDPIVLTAETPPQTTETLNTQLEAALATTMDALRTAAITRSPLPFRTLLTGARGTGGTYSIIQRLRALITGKPYQPDHTAPASDTNERK